MSRASAVDRLQQDVEAFLRKRQPDKPLCLFVGTSNPHVSWTSPTTFDPQQVEFPPHHLDTPETRSLRAAYYQEIKDLDRLIGQLRGLAAKHMSQDLLFVHSSDHGSQWPFAKWNLYDYGIRVPLIVSRPGHIEAGSRVDALVSWVDLLPTLIDIGDGQLPLKLDGRSFAKVLTGQTSQHRDLIFTTHTGDGTKNIFPIRSVRDSRWKLIHNLHPEFAHTNHSDLDRKPMAGGYWTEWAALAKTDDRAAAIVGRYFERPEWELFDLQKDKWEQHNLIDDPAHQARVAELRQKLAAWMEQQGDTGLVHSKPRLLQDRERWHPDHFVAPKAK
ncbi:MAG: sulfatase-like hydrolase/transferase [Planctomycetaceae bacterium]|nr:sulfatase-like hydrolase/transferase [Planctomycetaceae bacterium]